MNDWKFDATVAKDFVAHARKHIPNYDQVIGKSVDLCRKFLDPDCSIIDVGCATGETLARLSSAGYKNLTGVDASQDMLDRCTVNANLICSYQFPNQIFHAILCNWTLHFIKDKQTYLKNMHDSLTKDGFLVLSEKTSLDPLMIDCYHDYKSQRGASHEEIVAKAQQVKNIMFINDVSWYLTTLKSIGFDNVQIIDADYCFTTFLARKIP